MAHSAGSILLAPLVALLTGAGDGRRGLRIATVTLWAPACTIELFGHTYRPAIADGRIGRFALYTLTDKAEQDDNCAGVHRKSLLYLVSNALEEHPRTPFTSGTPLMGMERAIRRMPGLLDLLQSEACAWVRAPNDRHVSPDGPSATPLDASSAQHHGDFDDDVPTVSSTLARILGRGAGEEAPTTLPAFEHTRARPRDVREEVARDV